MEDIAISKEVLPTLEDFDADLEETILGDPKGCTRQYRNSFGLHVREYADRFVIHRDRVDPRANPVGHLIVDSPETLLSFFATSILASQRKRSSSSAASVGSDEYDEKDETNLSSSSCNSFFFLVLAFLSLNRIFRAIKKLF